MKTAFATLVAGLLTTLLCFTASAGDPPAQAPTAADLKAASVLVRVTDGSGSGVAVRVAGGTQRYVWTAAHVLAGQKKVETVIDPATGLPAVRISFAEVFLTQHEFEDGEYVGEVRRRAKIIRYSDEQDLAVLKVVKSGWPEKTVSFASATPADTDPVWHVGSMAGDRAHNSITDGLVSAVGRLRDELVYDQVSAIAYPGSSGGGVFNKSDGKCIGIVSEFATGRLSPGAVLIVPARRVREFAAKARCEWALGETPQAGIDSEAVMRDTVPLPKEWTPPAPTPSPAPAP